MQVAAGTYRCCPARNWKNSGVGLPSVSVKMFWPLCAESTALSSSLLGDELRKIDQLTTSFVELIASAHRYQLYWESVDFARVEADLRASQALLDRTQNSEQRDLEQKNLAVLLKRRERLVEIRQFIVRAHAQMKLIEKNIVAKLHVLQ